jgi:hypothetical protein
MSIRHAKIFYKKKLLWYDKITDNVTGSIRPAGSETAGTVWPA